MGVRPQGKEAGGLAAGLPRKARGGGGPARPSPALGSLSRHPARLSRALRTGRLSRSNVGRGPEGYLRPFERGGGPGPWGRPRTAGQQIRPRGRIVRRSTRCLPPRLRLPTQRGAGLKITFLTFHIALTSISSAFSLTSCSMKAIMCLIYHCMSTMLKARRGEVSRGNNRLKLMFEGTEGRGGRETLSKGLGCFLDL